MVKEFLVRIALLRALGQHHPGLRLQPLSRVWAFNSANAERARVRGLPQGNRSAGGSAARAGGLTTTPLRLRSHRYHRHRAQRGVRGARVAGGRRNVGLACADQTIWYYSYHLADMVQYEKYHVGLKC